ncbi:MAG TPA: RidA family protein [Candidatus Acidoferrum sp.]|nr:RidA family protein [Candidatus Acidoferrum sp.]
MKVRNINPWLWQDKLSFSQAVEASGTVLYCAGQASVDAAGYPIHIGDMRTQMIQAFDNLATLLAQSGYTFANVVRLNYYTTDVAAFHASYDVVTERLRDCPVKPSGSLLGVSELALPDLLVEIEATAVR